MAMSPHGRAIFPIFFLATLFLCLLFFAQLISSQTTKNHITRFPHLQVPAEKPPFNAYSGYLNVQNRGNGEDRRRLFYWFVESEENPQDKEIILYSNGGPGCASSIGFFEEVGPVKLIDKETVQLNDNSWHKFANILFIDHPVTAGFSKLKDQKGRDDVSGLPKNSEEAMMDLASALSEFVGQFPNYRNRDFYLAGESYAGKYLPTLLWLHDSKKVILPFNVKGLMLGNAVLYPSIQYGSIVQHATSFGITSYAETVELNSLLELCRRDILQSNVESQHDKTCLPLMERVLKQAGGLFAYDVRHTSKAIEAHKHLSQYAVHVDVKEEDRKALGFDKFDVKSSSNYYNFHRCSSSVTHLFASEFHQDLSDDILHTLLNLDKYSVLFYSGQFDLRVDNLGTQEFLRLYPWINREKFNIQKPILFRETTNAVPTGQFQYVDKVSLMINYEAGHLTGEGTKPSTTLEMAKRFVSQGNLCPDGKKNCRTPDKKSDLLSQCPNACSGHGKCKADFSCQCDKGYADSDCSTASLTYPLTSEEDKSVEKTYTGTLVGEEAMIYRFEIEPTTDIINLDFHLNRTSATGIPLLFVNVSSSDNTPNARIQKHTLRIKMDHNRFGGYSSDPGFVYFNNSRNHDKYLSLKHVPVALSKKNVISVGVYNAEKVAADFAFTMRVTPAVAHLHMFWFFFILAIIFVAVIIVEVWIIGTRLAQRRSLQKTQKYQRLIPEESSTMGDFRMESMNQFDSADFNEDEQVTYI